MSKHRNWVFTLNNYTADELETFRTCCTNGNVRNDGEDEPDGSSISGTIGNRGIKYLCFQPERGRDGNVPHLQGVLIFTNPRSLSGVRKISGRAHWEPMRGSVEQARSYCNKEETRDPEAGFGFTEFGEKPMGAGVQGHRSDLESVTCLIKSGKSAREIFEEAGEAYLKYHKGIERAVQFYSGRRTWKTTVYWFHGSTGTGKTKSAFERAPMAYFKTPSNHWWDGYEGQEEVIIDDYRPDFCKFSQLLRLFDRYPMSVEVKGGTVQFLAKKIYITTPKSPTMTWANRTEEDLAQLIRRIDYTECFDIPSTFPIFSNFVNGFNP